MEHAQCDEMFTRRRYELRFAFECRLMPRVEAATILTFRLYFERLRFQEISAILFQAALRDGASSRHLLAHGSTTTARRDTSKAAK